MNNVRREWMAPILKIFIEISVYKRSFYLCKLFSLFEPIYESIGLRIDVEWKQKMHHKILT